MPHMPWPGCKGFVDLFEVSPPSLLLSYILSYLLLCLLFITWKLLVKFEEPLDFMSFLGEMANHPSISYPISSLFLKSNDTKSDLPYRWDILETLTSILVISYSYPLLEYSGSFESSLESSFVISYDCLWVSGSG